MQIQWYPGHMAKTKRLIAENIKMVDLVAEVIDGRIPISSRNPDINELIGDKPRILVINRTDLADPDATKIWSKTFKADGLNVLETNGRSGAGVNQFPLIVNHSLQEKVRLWREKGQVGRKMRVMVVGIPNVGKSTFINKVAGRKSAAAENRPGVTRGKQWITINPTLELLDTPGILWPKFEDKTTALNLSFTGAVKDSILDQETLASHLIVLLAARYPDRLKERFKISASPDDTGWELLESAGRKRGFLISGGEIDIERTARVLLDEFRSGKFGRTTLEWPDTQEDSNE